MMSTGCRRASIFAHLALGVLLSPFLIRPVEAQPFLPLDQLRTVNGFVIVPQCGGDDSDARAANGFEPFNGVAISTLGCDLGSAVAAGHQRSRIDPSLMLATAETVSTARAEAIEIIHAIADSIFEVTFEVGAETPFTLIGSISSAASHENLIILAGADVVLTGPDGDVLIAHSVQPGPGGARNTVDFDETGALRPGTHTLRATASTVIDNEVPPGRFATASFQVALRPL